MTTHPTGGAPAAAHAKRLAEATEIISAGVADDLSSEETAGNVLSMVECEAILSAPAASERVVEAVVADLGLLFKDDFGCNSPRCVCIGAQAFECKAGITLDKIARAAIEAYQKAMREGT